MHKKQRVFLFLGLLFALALLCIYIVYLWKYKVFIPKAPVVHYRIAASDSMSYANTYCYNFENIKNNKHISTEYAFSGKQSAKVTGKNRYSIIIQKPFKEFHYDSMGEARFGAWVYLPAKDEKWSGKFVFQIVNANNKVKYSHLVPIQKESPMANTWFYISGKADIKDVELEATDRVKVFYWNNCNRDVYMDDVVMILGNQHLKGNKPMVDETAKNYSFHAFPNQPPYETFYAKKELAVNVKNTSILSIDGTKFLALEGDNFVSGYFVSNNAKTQQLLILKHQQPTAIVWFVPEKNLFSFIKIDDTVFSSEQKEMAPLAADVNGDGVDEIICVGEDAKDLEMFAFNPRNQKIARISKESSHIEKGIKLIQTFHQKSNKKQSLLALDKTGEAFLLDFEKGVWTNRFLGYLTEGAQINYESKMITGNFIQADATDNVLFLYKEGRTNRCFYKLFEVDIEQGKSICIQQRNFDNKCDTLNPENTYFVGDLDGNGIKELISYSNSWRYDMKWICFTDKDYRIMGNIDFKGYDKDYNPKYYENLMLSAGNFTGHKTFSFFTLCKNRNAHTDLPENVGLYSLSISNSE